MATVSLNRPVRTDEARMDMREAIMAAARTTVQRDGYNALSFRDLASEVGIKSASVHYHFPTKPDLAEALANRYCEDMTTFLEEVSQNAKTTEAALETYVALFRSGLDGTNRMCVIGMMSAEVNALPPSVTVQLERFAQINTDWLQNVLAIKNPRMAKDKLEARALAIYASIEGAQLIARGRGGDPLLFDEIVAAYKVSGLLG